MLSRKPRARVRRSSAFRNVLFPVTVDRARGCRHPARVFSREPGRISRRPAARESVAVVLGTERVVDGARLASALVIDHNGAIAGFQDKIQLDPAEEPTY